MSVYSDFALYSNVPNTQDSSIATTWQEHEMNSILQRHSPYGTGRQIGEVCAEENVI
jgi:hypothetical protein